MNYVLYAGITAFPGTCMIVPPRLRAAAPGQPPGGRAGSPWAEKGVPGHVPATMSPLRTPCVAQISMSPVPACACPPCARRAWGRGRRRWTGATAGGPAWGAAGAGRGLPRTAGSVLKGFLQILAIHRPHGRGNGRRAEKKEGARRPLPSESGRGARYSSGGSSLSWAMVNTGPSTQT